MEGVKKVGCFADLGAGSGILKEMSPPPQKKKRNNIIKGYITITSLQLNSESNQISGFHTT